MRHGPFALRSARSQRRHVVALGERHRVVEDQRHAGLQRRVGEFDHFDRLRGHVPVGDEAGHGLALQARALGNLDVVIAEHGVERHRSLAAMLRWAGVRDARRLGPVERQEHTIGSHHVLAHAVRRAPSRADRRDRSCRRASRPRRRGAGAAPPRARPRRASGAAASAAISAARRHRRMRRTRAARGRAHRLPTRGDGGAQEARSAAATMAAATRLRRVSRLASHRGAA